jgi:hypothetical protein
MFEQIRSSPEGRIIIDTLPLETVFVPVIRFRGA